MEWWCLPGWISRAGLAAVVSSASRVRWILAPTRSALEELVMPGALPSIALEQAWQIQPDPTVPSVFLPERVSPLKGVAVYGPLSQARRPRQSPRLELLESRDLAAGCCEYHPRSIDLRHLFEVQHLEAVRHPPNLRSDLSVDAMGRRCAAARVCARHGQSMGDHPHRRGYQIHRANFVVFLATVKTAKSWRIGDRNCGAVVDGGINGRETGSAIVDGQTMLFNWEVIDILLETACRPGWLSGSQRRIVQES